MLLAIDVDNSHFALACMEDGAVASKFMAAVDKRQTKDQFSAQIYTLLTMRGIDTALIDGAIISSVVPSLTDAVRDAVRDLFGVSPLVVGPGIKTGLNIRMDNPAQLGSDLVVSSVACLAKYKTPAIIINMTTAITFAVLNGKGEYVGGCMCPGLDLSLRCLIENADLVPSISLERPRKVIGTNTVESLRSGVVFSAAMIIDGMVKRLETELGSACTVVILGPEANNILPYCETKMVYSEDLIFEGLYLIYQKNIS